MGTGASRARRGAGRAGPAPPAAESAEERPHAAASLNETDLDSPLASLPSPLLPPRFPDAGASARPAPHAAAARPAAAAGAPPPEPHLFSFGLCADVQYADIPDGASWKGTPRRYRGSLAALRRAADHWREDRVDFVLHLGEGGG